MNGMRYNQYDALVAQRSQRIHDGHKVLFVAFPSIIRIKLPGAFLTCFAFFASLRD